MKNISQDEKEKMSRKGINSNEKIVFDLSGNNWQMEGIRPGEGVKTGFHELNFDITGDSFNWIYAKVPGDVYTDLWRAGRLDDPHFGRNSLKAKWVPENEWWYKRQFDVPREMFEKRIQLVFDGVDFACDVWLNGEFLGTHEGMFSKFKFDVSKVIRFENLRFGTNVLMVRLHPAPRRYSQVAGRKPAWHGDYWVSLPPTGIWKPVYLEAMGNVTVEDTYVKLSILSKNSAKLNIEVELENHTDQSKKLELQIDVEGENFDSKIYRISKEINVDTGIQKLDVDLVIDEAKLWWPWDLGDQNLYKAKVTVLEGENLHDTTETTFGIREIKMEHNPGFTREQVENPWTVMINGKRHFMRSGTWGGPPDIFMGRAHKSKYEELIRLAKEANFNNLRIFGWHPEEIPYFYELCNRAGITVWQDVLPLASLSLPKEEEFKKAVFEEAIASVKEQRNHPCIVLLEGSEELFMTASDPQHNLNFVNELGEAIKPYTSLYYIPSSPLSDEVGLNLGFKPNESYHANDLFYGEGEFVMEDYFPSLDYAVIPELAISSCPNVESIKKFIPEDEIWPPGPSWGHHWTDFDALRTLNFEVLGDQSRDGFEKFVEATQIAQGVIFQYALEHFRTRKPKTSAICICHYITFAPDMKWGIVDYYQEKKLSFDYVKKAYQPVLITMKHDNRRWLPGEEFIGELWIVNDYYKSFKNSKTMIKFLDANKSVVKQEFYEIDQILGDSSKKFIDVSCGVPGKLGDKFYVEINLVNENGQELSANDYMLLVADKKKDKETLKAIGKEAFDIKQKYGWANYFRYYPSLGGETGYKEADEVMPVARGFEK
ncbi:glycoside hydrolase family 2 protein [Tenacibaculum jejuense]|uniref:beta-mannosidase n=1 Tax=Tenacibaculum jejuense TaxID=584609 RepID=A0A238UC98_9FLAO|nr:sugar-binding domain-containing protein [Tenacibaculum jejuense]SNR16616.1 Glycoside hydrolase family 2 [Tenacibaculum jejuense]